MAPGFIFTGLAGASFETRLFLIVGQDSEHRGIIFAVYSLAAAIVTVAANQYGRFAVIILSRRASPLMPPNTTL